MGDRNCCPCMFCHSDNILPKERPSLTSICHGEKALSLRIESLPCPNHKKNYNHISALSIANSRTAPESSVYLPEIAWNKMWNTWLWIWTFLFLVQIRTVHILHIFHILIVDQPHPGRVSIFNRLRASWISTSLVYYSSGLHIGSGWRDGPECQGCHNMFATIFAYDQHRRSPHLRRTACCALPDENRVNVTSVSRANMSTTLVERRAAKRTRGRAPKWHILHISYVSAYIC